MFEYYTGICYINILRVLGLPTEFTIGKGIKTQANKVQKVEHSDLNLNIRFHIGFKFLSFLLVNSTTMPCKHKKKKSSSAKTIFFFFHLQIMTRANCQT